jgi:hypothetical protein
VNRTPQLALSGVEDYNPNTHGFCSTAKDPPNFDLVYDRKKPTSVIDSVGDPKMSFRRVADVNVAMSKRYGMLIAMGVLANEFDRVAGSDLLVDIATTINSIRRFVFEVCYPRWI